MCRRRWRCFSAMSRHSGASSTWTRQALETMPPRARPMTPQRTPMRVRIHRARRGSRFFTAARRSGRPRSAAARRARPRSRPSAGERGARRFARAAEAPSRGASAPRSRRARGSCSSRTRARGRAALPGGALAPGGRARARSRAARCARGARGAPRTRSPWPSPRGSIAEGTPGERDSFALRRRDRSGFTASDPELGAPRSAVHGALFVGGDLRLLGRRPPGLDGEGALHEAILERLEREDRGVTTVVDDLRQRGQERGELVELAVDRDANGLKAPGGGVDAPDADRADRAHDRAAEIERGVELVGQQRLLDAAGDAARAALVAVLVDDVRELVVGQAIDELERGLAALAVHAHVDRSFAAEAHAALRVVELGGADAEIGDEPVDATDAEEIELLTNGGERRLDEGDAVGDGGEALTRRFDGDGIAIEGDDARPWFDLEEGDGVAPAAERDVDVDPAGARRDRPHDLVSHDGRVLEALHVGHLVEVIAPYPFVWLHE